MVADGTVALQGNGDAYWVEPLDLTDQASAISADIVLAAVTAPGNMRPGGAVSEATARTASSPMPPPRRLTPQEPPPRPPGVPETWAPRLANNGHGWVWQLPGSPKSADSARVMDYDVNGRHLDGYVVFANRDNQPLTIDGKCGTPAETHIPRAADGSYPLPPGWPDAHTATAPR